jgi:NAD(P)-dependent dehydrogenase (short-subunit alcohol dehydrogenase family)
MAHDRWFTTGLVVVTEATDPLGRAIAARFARVGAKLGLIGHDRNALELLADELRGAATDIAFATVDISDARAVESAVALFERELGPISICVNHAPPPVSAPLLESTPEEFKRATETGYLGVVFACMGALRKMRPRNRGRIINITSALGFGGAALQAAYGSSQYTIRGFTAALRSELQHEASAITVSMVVLPAMQATRAPRLWAYAYEPAAAADAVLSIARTRARENWLGAPTLLTVLASMISPSLLDKHLTRTGYRGWKPGSAHAMAHPRSPGTATIVSGSVGRAAAFALCAMLFTMLGAAVF